MEENKEELEQEEVKIPKKEKRKIEKLAEELESLKVELEKAKKNSDDWKNKFYMAHADTQNMKKQYEKEHIETIKYRAAGFIENLMPALDSFHCALQMKSDDQKMQNFLTGFEYIYKNILSVLENEGVAKLEPEIGNKFDASYMHAIDSEESDAEPNTVVKVLSVGYKLKDRIIRPAMVIVAKKKEENTDTNKDIK